jgi:hypothetical protein
MLCADSDLAAAMPRIVADIDYANFKDEVALVTGKARAKRYVQVWSALYGMEEDLPEPERTDWQGLPWPEKNPVVKPQGQYSRVASTANGRCKSIMAFNRAQKKSEMDLAVTPSETR